MRQQLPDLAVGLGRQSFEHILQVPEGLVAVEPRGLDQAHDGSRALARPQAPREEPVLAPERNRPDLVLDPVRVVSENGKNRTLSRSSAPRCKQPARRRAVDDAGESWALPATPALRLNRRAFHRAEGTEHAAVAGVGAQQRLAVAALVEELAGVGRHGFLLGISTAWARQHGLQDNGTHGAPCPVARTLRLTLPLLARCATT